MTLLIAPDKFKDALDAHDVARAIASGLTDSNREVNTICCPLGDGGEGTGALLAAAAGLQTRELTVLDPLGREHTARWWHDAATQRAIIEMAEASGLALLERAERRAIDATSFGTGQLLRAAYDAGCRDLLLCVGGSATVDGGAGCLQALGWRCLDAAGHPIAAPLTGGRLTDVAALRPADDFHDATVRILCDVRNPLLGPEGAAPVFARQKGANDAEIRQLDANLHHWAAILATYAGREVSTLSGGGAAGGIAAGLAACLGAELRDGFEYVADALDLRDSIADCDLVITGEGRLDSQTAGGKTVAGVARLAQELGKPTIAFVGALELRPGETREQAATDLSLREIVVVTPAGTPLERALREAADNLHTAARRFAGTIRA